MVTWQLLGPIALCAYAYASAARQQRHADIATSVAFFFAELLWEMSNATFGHFAGAPLWSVAGDSACVIYVGLNLEIALLFAIFPLVVLGLRPQQKRRRIPLALAIGALCVAVEVALNHAGLLLWHWPFWRPPHLYLVIVAYALPAWLLFVVRDALTLRALWRLVVLLALAALFSHLLLRHRLGWV